MTDAAERMHEALAIGLAEGLAIGVAKHGGDTERALWTFHTMPEVNAFRAMLSKLGALTADRMALIVAKQDQLHRRGLK
jgi:hypothetical protein